MHSLVLRENVRLHIRYVAYFLVQLASLGSLLLNVYLLLLLLLLGVVSIDDLMTLQILIMTVQVWLILLLTVGVVAILVLKLDLFR